jgi:putative flippase GtrA
MAAAIQRQFETIWTSGILGQLIRYGFAGALATAVYSSVYMPLALWVFPGGHAVFAVPFAFMTALTAGFFLHSHFSFAGHGTRENSGRQHAKFLMVHCVGLSMNLAFTWGLTAGLGAPAWAPLLPSVTLTPLVTFVLQRQWVFS